VQIEVTECLLSFGAEHNL